MSSNSDLASDLEDALATYEMLLERAHLLARRWGEEGSKVKESEWRGYCGAMDIVVSTLRTIVDMHPAMAAERAHALAGTEE